MSVSEFKDVSITLGVITLYILNKTNTLKL